MKLTKSKLREMITEELREISGTFGSGFDIAKVRKAVDLAKSKLASRGTKDVAKKIHEDCFSSLQDKSVGIIMEGEHLGFHTTTIYEYPKTPY